MPRVDPPAPPYLGPAAHTTAGENKPVARIVIHSTVSPCEPGGARDIAAYFRSPKAGGSAHYVVDPGDEVQVVWDSAIAWHAPPNQHSLGIEMCDVPGPVPGDKPGTAAFKAARRAWRWTRPEQKAMLDRTARLTAQLCAAYSVPPVFVGAAKLRAGARGVTTHAQVSQAWRQSTHWDPGFWPRRRFMRLVRRHYAELTDPAPEPEPEPEPVPAAPFTAATWNVFHGSTLDDLRPVLVNIRRQGASVLLLQEATQVGLEDVLLGFGYRCFRVDQCVVAWNQTWTQTGADSVQLSEVPWFSEGSKAPRRPVMTVATLQDAAGRSLTVGSYHTPPTVQAGGKPRDSRRLDVLKAAAKTWAQVAATADTTAVLLGGDDNVDESGGWWKFLRRPATGLRLVKAPDATLGKRRIDDFRVRGLTVVDQSTMRGTTAEQPAHRVHLATFRPVTGKAKRR